MSSRVQAPHRRVTAKLLTGIVRCLSRTRPFVYVSTTVLVLVLVQVLVLVLVLVLVVLVLAS